MYLYVKFDLEVGCEIEDLIVECLINLWIKIIIINKVCS